MLIKCLIPPESINKEGSADVMSCSLLWDPERAMCRLSAAVSMYNSRR